MKQFKYKEQICSIKISQAKLQKLVTAGILSNDDFHVTGVRENVTFEHDNEWVKSKREFRKYYELDFNLRASLKEQDIQLSAFKKDVKRIDNTNTSKILDTLYVPFKEFVVNSKLVGAMNVHKFGNFTVIDAIYVHPLHRKQGIATEEIKKLCSFHKVIAAININSEYEHVLSKLGFCHATVKDLGHLMLLEQK